jgi:insulysin
LGALQLSKTTASAGHPYHKFGTGSWVTLWETPSTLGLDLRQQLLQFHETYYSANVMTLCIIGKYVLS